MTEEQDREPEDESVSQAPVNLPPPPLVPVGPNVDFEDIQPADEPEEDRFREDRPR